MTVSQRAYNKGTLNEQPIWTGQRTIVLALDYSATTWRNRKQKRLEMQRVTFLRLISCLVIALNFSLLTATASQASDAVPPQNSPTKVGGWYPVFFDQEDQALLQNIIDKSKSGLVSKLIVDFDKNSTLAKKIIDALKANCQCLVESRLSENRDTDSVKFNHQRVTVLVYSVK